MGGTPKAQRRLVNHPTHLLSGVCHALNRGGEHGALDLFVAEPREHGDDDEHDRRDQEWQLSAKRLLREEKLHGEMARPRAGGFWTPKRRATGIIVTNAGSATRTVRFNPTQIGTSRDRQLA